jgi:hypothetical protein
VRARVCVCVCACARVMSTVWACVCVCVCVCVCATWVGGSNTSFRVFSKVSPHCRVVRPTSCLPLGGSSIRYLVQVNVDGFPFGLEPESPPKVGRNAIDPRDDLQGVCTCVCVCVLGVGVRWGECERKLAEWDDEK